MEINIWTLILDNFHQWNFFKQFYKSSFSNRYFNEQSAHRLPNPRSNPLPLLQNETKQKDKKKKRRKKKKERIKIIHRLIKTEIQEENINWSDEIKKNPDASRIGPRQMQRGWSNSHSFSPWNHPPLSFLFYLQFYLQFFFFSIERATKLNVIPSHQREASHGCFYIF